MESDFMQSWLWLQVVLEAVLVVLMIAFFIKLRRISSGEGGKPPAEMTAAMERFLEQSQKLSDSLAANLEEKKELSVSLILKLERKINEMNELLQQAERRDNYKQAPPETEERKANPAAPENRALVVRLAAKGLSVEEIARRSKLHRGEVELILDLEKQFGA